MTKEQIKEKASKLVNKEIIPDNNLIAFEKGFFMGAEWLLDNMWISVEDELPPFDEEVIVRAINQRGEIMFFGHRSDNEYVVKDKYCFCSFDENETITHWMPIPKLNEK